MTIRILVTEKERAQIQQAAARDGLSVSKWAESALVDFAQIELGGARG